MYTLSTSARYTQYIYALSSTAVIRNIYKFFLFYICVCNINIHIFVVCRLQKVSKYVYILLNKRYTKQYEFSVNQVINFILFYMEKIKEKEEIQKLDYNILYICIFSPSKNAIEEIGKGGGGCAWRKRRVGLDDFI